MSLLLLNDDCLLRIVLHCTCSSILSFAQVSKQTALICNNKLIWQLLLHNRTGRDIHTLDPKALFRRSLHAGTPRFVSPLDGEYWSHPCCSELEQRRDITRSSIFLDFANSVDFVTCVTIDDRCLVHMHDWTAEDFHLQRDVGQAQDALIYSGTEYWYVALLYNGRLRILQFEGNDIDTPVELLVLKKRKVKKLLSCEEIPNFNDNPNPTCIICLLENNTVVSATCEVPSKVKVLARNVHNCFVVDYNTIHWSTAPNTKYVRFLIQRSPGHQDIRAHLVDKKLRYIKYGDSAVYDKRCKKKVSWNLSHVGELIPPSFDFAIEPKYREKPHLAAYSHKDGVDDVWISITRDIFVRSGRTILHNSDRDHKWRKLAENVLWVRTTSIDRCTCMILEP